MGQRGWASPGNFRGAIAIAAVIALLFGAGHVIAGPNWQIVASPNAHATQHNFLNDISCVTESDCWAVGYYRADNAYQAITQHWDGTSWSLHPAPETSATHDDYVQSVACASASECFVVGYSWSRPDSAYRALIQRWDGTSWSDASPRDAGLASNSYLIDVTCSSSADCWAVGHRQIGLLGGGFGPRQTLAMHWNGTSWESVTSPNTLATQGNGLTSVSCVSTTDCWAVGSYSAGSAEQSLAMHWDGSVWEIVASPNTNPVHQNLFNGVTCTAATDCWAVGISTDGVNKTLVQRWDGSSWTIVASPNTGPGFPNVLFNVDCLANDDCWAVGYHKQQPWLETLMLRWDGQRWTVAPSPNSAPGQTNTLRGVACVTQHGCWAVGNYYDAQSISRTLTTRYLQGPIEPVATELSLTLDESRGDILITALLSSSTGAVLEGREIVFSINGHERARVDTDHEGRALVLLHRNEIKRHDLVEARFLGDKGLAGSQASTRLSD